MGIKEGKIEKKKENMVFYPLGVLLRPSTYRDTWVSGRCVAAQGRAELEGGSLEDGFARIVGNRDI